MNNFYNIILYYLYSIITAVTIASIKITHIITI